MTQPSTLEWWKSKCNRMIDPIQSVKQEILEYRKAFDADCPEWREKYEQNEHEFGKHDARREYFVSLRVILTNSQLTHIFMRDHLSSEMWWRELTGNFSITQTVEALREQAIMAKFFTIHGAISSTEETLRAIVRSAPYLFSIEPAAEFQSVYFHMFKVLKLNRYKILFELARLTRNTIHTNGVFFPRNGKDARVCYAGRIYVFKVGDGLSWLGDTFPIWMVQRLAKAMTKIIGSAKVVSIKYVPRAG